MAGGKSMTARILRAMSVFTGVQAVTILCALLRTKFIALWIGPVGVGLFAIFNSVLDMLSGATQLNMGQSAVRDISVARDGERPRMAAAVRWWAVRLGAAGALLMVILAPLLSWINFDGMSYWWVFAALALAMYCLAVRSGELAIMQGANELRALAKATAIGAVAGTVASIPMYYFFGEASVVPSIIVFAGANVIAALSQRRIASAPIARAESISAGKGFLKLGGYITLSLLVSQMASYAFIAYLNRTGSTATVGLFQAGYTLIIHYVGIIFTALATEYYPRISRIADRSRMASVVVSRQMAIILAILAPVVIIFIAADELIVKILYTSEFEAILPFIAIGICGTVFRGISYCMSYVIIARGDGRTFVVTEVVDSIVGLTLNIVLFRTWGFVGLGISYVLWYVIYTAIVGTVYRVRYAMTIAPRVIGTATIVIILVISALALREHGVLSALTPLLPAVLLTVRVLKNPTKN